MEKNLKNKLKLDIGCGTSKHEGYLGIDCQDLPGVDLVCDCNERIPLTDNCASEILAINFIEHIRNDRRIHIMEEMWRMLCDGGTLKIMVPDSTRGQGAFQDPTHLSFWCTNSFRYYSDDTYRALYGIKAKFDIISMSSKVIPTTDVVYVQCELRAVKSDRKKESEYKRVELKSKIAKKEKETVDVVMLTATKTAELFKMTQNAIDTLHASDSDYKFNVVLMESWNYEEHSKLKENANNVHVNAKRKFLIDNHEYEGPVGSENSDITVIDNSGFIFATSRKGISVRHKKKEPIKSFGEYKNCKIVKCYEKFNFHRFMTYGLKHGKAEHVILCNNDVIFAKGWYSLLREKMKKHKLDSASPRCNNWVLQKKLMEKYPKAKVILGAKTSVTISGWCICTTRSALNKMGGLDDRQPYYSSDNTYMMRLRSAGLRHALVVDSIVTHLFNITTKAVPERSELYASAHAFMNREYPGWNREIELTVLE